MSCKPSTVQKPCITQNSDAFACAASFLSIHEVTRLRLVSKRFQRAADSDAVWATIVQEQLNFVRVVPICRCGGWRQFVQRWELHRPSQRMLSVLHSIPVMEERDASVASIRSALDQAGQWVSVASVPPATGAASTSHRPLFHSGCTNLFDMIAGPTSLSGLTKVSSATCSVGIVVTHDINGSRLSATSDAVLTSIHEQMLEFLQLRTTARPASSLMDELLYRRPETESVASLELFNAAPHSGRDGSHRCVLLLRVTEMARTNPAAVAMLMEAMFHVCSSIQFVGHQVEDLLRFCKWYGASLPTVAAAPFSTSANTPSVAFTVSSPTLTTNDNNERWDGPPTPPMATPQKEAQEALVDLAEFVAECPAEFNSWLFNRTCSVGSGFLEHKNLFSLAKPFHCPSWVNAGVTASISPATILRMIQGFLDDGGNAWSVNVVKFQGGQEEQRVREFYESAIQTEFAHHTRPEEPTTANATTATEDIPTPMDPLLMVEAHNLYFYAAIRKFGYALPLLCGRDADGGLRLLEVLKRNVSDVFRFYWRRNNEYSRIQCHAIFSRTFGPITAKYLDPTSSPLLVDSKRRGLKQWYAAMQDKIMEYDLKAKGLRKYDILSEELNDTIFPQLRQFLQTHNPLHASQRPDGLPATHEEDAERAMADLRQMVIDRTAADTKVTDGTLNRSQHESALYTAAMSNELVSLQSKATVAFLQSIEDDSEAWEQACLWRIRSLTTHRRPQNSTQSHKLPVDVASTSSTTNAPSIMAVTAETGSALDTEAEVPSLAHDDDDDESEAIPAIGGHLEHDDDLPQGLLLRYAEGREQMISETMAEEADRRSQATRLSARLDQQRSVFDVVARERSQQGRSGGALSRVKRALKNLMS